MATDISSGNGRQESNLAPTALISRYLSLRVALIGFSLVVAAGRFGLLSVATSTHVPDVIYGIGFVIVAIWMGATFNNGSRNGWAGRMAAVCAAALFIGLAVDVLPFAASAAMMFWCGVMALGEAVTWNDC